MSADIHTGSLFHTDSAMTITSLNYWSHFGTSMITSITFLSTTSLPRSSPVRMIPLRFHDTIQVRFIKVKVPPLLTKLTT